MQQLEVENPTASADPDKRFVEERSKICQVTAHEISTEMQDEIQN
jgi:hypothetical protein